MAHGQPACVGSWRPFAVNDHVDKATIGYPPYNSLFLSCRFRARREGQYNAAIYTFFQGRNPDRIQYVRKGMGCMHACMESEIQHEAWQH